MLPEEASAVQWATAKAVASRKYVTPGASASGRPAPGRATVRAIATLAPGGVTMGSVATLNTWSSDYLILGTVSTQRNNYRRLCPAYI